MTPSEQSDIKWPNAAGGGGRRHGYCRLCGEPTAAITVIQVQDRRKHEGRGTLASGGVTLCEAHALELWGKLIEVLDPYKQ